MKEECVRKWRITISKVIRAYMPMEMGIDGEMQALKIIGHTMGRNQAHQSDRLIIPDNAEAVCLE